LCPGLFGRDVLTVLVGFERRWAFYEHMQADAISRVERLLRDAR